MALRPGAALLTFTNAASASTSLWVNEVVLTKIVEPFQRAEFLNSRTRETKNPSGGLPIIVNTIANLPIQIGVACAGDIPRVLGPETDSTLNAYSQKFTIQRYTLRGASTPKANLDLVQATAILHESYLQKFAYHLARAGSDISYPDLLTLRTENFSYLTSTGVSISGNCLGGTASEMLIVSFQQDITTSVTQADGSQLLLAEWSMVIDNRTISSQASP